MENHSTYYLEQKSYFGVKPYERNNIMSLYHSLWYDMMHENKTLSVSSENPINKSSLRLYFGLKFSMIVRAQNY